MKLVSLKLKDFRQFRGENIIHFSPDDNKVTVIFGTNGVGKTGIFRAVIFCLFGQTYLDRDHLDQKQRNQGLDLVNYAAVDEAQGRYVEASVSLSFEHQDDYYELTRTIFCRKNVDEYDKNNTEVSLTQTKGCNTLAPITDDSEIRTILEGVIDHKNKDLFLFDGEQMEELTKSTSASKENIQKGINSFLKINSIKAAKKALESLRSDIWSEIKHSSNSVELTEVNTLIEENDARINATLEELKRIGKEFSELEDEIAELESKIRDSKQGADKQKEKDSHQERIKQLNNSLSDTRKEIKDQFKSISLHFAESIISDTSSDLQLKVDCGKLPAHIKESFILDLINKGMCICGNDLKENLDAVGRLRKYISTYVDDHAEAGFKVYLLVNQLNSLIKGKDYSNSLEKITSSYRKTLGEITTQEKLIERLDEELMGYKDTKDYSNRLEIANKDKSTNLINKGKCENALETYRKEAGEYAAKFEKLSKDDQKLQMLERRYALVTQAIDEIDNILLNYSQDIQDRLSLCATDIIKEIADRKTLQAISRIVITEDFSLKVLNASKHDTLREISSGQRQIVSIAYICSLMQLASGLKMPLLMDTPFGRLSGEHRDSCLEKLPSLLSQWILLTTDTEMTMSEARALRRSGEWQKIYEINKDEDGVSRIIEKDINTWNPNRN